MTAHTSTSVDTRNRRYTVRDREGNVVGKAELRSVPTNVVKIDSAYQRDVSRTWVSDHMPFDPNKAGAIVLSGRAGGPYCIDGGHRLELAKESGIPHIHAFVIDGLTKMDEARLFTQYQRERRNLTSWALWRAEIVAADPESMAMARIVRNCGFDIAKNSGPRNITAIDAVRYVHRLGGDDLLTRTLQCIGAQWVGEEKALSGQVIKGIAIFLASAGHQPNFRQERFVKVMSANAPLKVLRLSQAIAAKRAATTSNSAANVAEALWQEYNKVAAQSQEQLSPLTIGNKRRPSPRKGGNPHE